MGKWLDLNKNSCLSIFFFKETNPNPSKQNHKKTPQRNLACQLIQYCSSPVQIERFSVLFLFQNWQSVLPLLLVSSFSTPLWFGWLTTWGLIIFPHSVHGIITCSWALHTSTTIYPSGSCFAPDIWFTLLKVNSANLLEKEKYTGLAWVFVFHLRDHSICQDCCRL